MKERFLALAELFNNKPIRERAILAGMILAVLWGFFSFVFVTPLEQDAAAQEKRLERTQGELQKLSAQEMVLAKALTQDPNAAKKREIRNLEKQLVAIEENLQELAVGLIPAQELPQALHEVLRESGKLNLLGMQTKAPSQLKLEAEPVATDEDQESLTEEEEALAAIGELNVDGAATAPSSRAVGVFKHAVVVSLEGSYFDVLDYIKAIEGLQWRIYWQALDYEVTRYPKARVTLEVYTLSTEAGVLGV